MGIKFKPHLSSVHVSQVRFVSSSKAGREAGRECVTSGWIVREGEGKGEREGESAFPGWARVSKAGIGELRVMTEERRYSLLEEGKGMES